MVQNSGKTLCADAYRSVNAPEPVGVIEAPSGLPLAVKKLRRQAITAVEDRWRIDDEWWRREPISRLYYEVILAFGQRLVLYKDLGDSRWYKQSY